MNKRILTIGGIAVAVLVVVALVWFQPQKLFIDETVNEEPVAAEPMDDDMEMMEGDSSADAPEVLQGTFESLEHPTSGSALAEGSTLRLEDFETENGPDLRVILSVRDGDDYDSDFIDLGALKGNKGAQNYEIPEGTDLERYDHAVIWCRRFKVAFGAAELA